MPSPALLRAASCNPTDVIPLLDTEFCDWLRARFHAAHAEEGSVWLVDGAEEHLVPVANTGPDAAKFVGRFRQPLNTGLVSMVFVTEQPFMENDVAHHPRQSRLLDAELGVRTCALIAAPLHLHGRCAGAISCVQLSRSAEETPPTGFAPSDLAEVQRIAAELAPLLEAKRAAQAQR